MKDYEISIKNAKEVSIYKTDNDTLVIPSSSDIETDKNNTEIKIKDVEEAVIGIPKEAGHIELSIEDASLTVKGISFERMEIDGKGKLVINLDDIAGSIDVNLIDGSAEMTVPSAYSFKARTEGKNNTIDCQAQEDAAAENIIELNGRNSTLLIRN